MSRIAWRILAFAVLLPAAGALLQGIAAWRDSARIAPPGEYLTVNGAELHVYCSGPEDGPAILLENGMGVVSDAWVRVQAALADTYRVCRYDRAGTGHSSPYAGPADAGASADRLAVLLNAVGLDEPVIVVGHSYGGLIARVFADRHTERVAGIVLVDSSHEDMGERLPPQGQELVEEILGAFSLLEALNRFGVLRLVGPPAAWMNGLEGDARVRARALYSRVAHMRGAAAEAEAWRDGRSTKLARHAEALDNLPLLVLVADDYPHGLAAPWLELQRELAALSSNSSLKLVAGADHYGLIQERDHAARVSGEIDAFARRIHTVPQ